ncbi:hypothetical protein C8Q80DRAFT_1220321 [Daedaleopsis nitida]|nr:hypothetical protein C8Q80DRAFT_1220321 [Daedaleopsis nitida]
MAPPNEKTVFANNRILPNLKRRPRPTNKSDATSPARIHSKIIHILPNVAEEDESTSRLSCSSASSLTITPTHQPHPLRPLGGSATLGARPTTPHDKRDSRRVVLTGVEGLTFDDFFPPSSAPRVRTPSPPPRPITPPRSVASSPISDCTLDDIKLRFSGLGISLDFPPPPSSATLSRRRDQSPTPSVSSSEASTASPKTPCSTPPTSDDDESPSKSNLMRAPTFKSQRASVLFMKSMSDLCEPVRKSSITSFVEEDVSEEVEWIAQDISDIVTLSSPETPTSPLPPSDFQARPDSMPPPPRRSRSNKVHPVLPRISIQDNSARGPSAQLDPTFPLRRRSYLVPTRPPPPPPMPKSPGLSAMEQATEELLAELANAALGAGFLGTELTIPYDAWSNAGSVPPSPSSHFVVTTPVSASGLRPPPRSSVPADIHDFCEESPVELSLPPRRDVWPTTPQSASVYSQNSSSPASPLSSFDFDIDVTFVESESQSLPHAPESPLPMRRSPSTLSISADPERTLRSRWSTSTLGSLAEAHSHSWLPRFTLSPSKKAKSKAVAAPVISITTSHSHSHSHSASSMSPLQRKNALKGAAHAAKRSIDSDRSFAAVDVSRRDSRSSRVSESSASDSGDSTTSAGLRRKPIPFALLSVSGPQNSMSL